MHGTFPWRTHLIQRPIEAPVHDLGGIERQIKAGGNPDELWEALYLDSKQIEEFLKHAKAKKNFPAGHTYARVAAYTGPDGVRYFRVKPEDVDIEGQVVTIKEKKRQRGTRTTRRVPIAKKLAAALRPLPSEIAITYLGDGQEPLSIDQAHRIFKRITRSSKWANIRGWHTLRHSLCSIAASSGTDQRLIDSWLSHSTEQQRKRYRHLFPQTQQTAMSKLFA